MRAFMKMIYRYSHARSYRHNENLWPDVKIVRATNQEICKVFYKKKPISIIPLSEWKDSCHGNVLLTATGPSVNNVLFECVPDMPAIGVNGAYFLHQKVDFRFYVIVDMGFIDQRSHIVLDIIQQTGLTLFTTVHGMVRIIDRFGRDSIKCRLSIIEDAAYKIYRPKIDDTALWEHYHNDHCVDFSADRKTIAFSRDIRSGIFDAGTVVYWTLQIIAFLGFKQLFIVGLDMNNFHLPRFYETEQNKQPTCLPEKMGSTVIPAFKHASIIMKKNHISITNLSLNSAIDSNIFEKVDYHDYFKKV
ncbi:lipopolysaccharide core biosynthesis protein [Serratia fonticola]|uniref:sugar glycosyltransferase n=1 Tax=Serratia fonticola TaxID=47917 RepID=UPI0021790E0A|nr:sugar glycosyltransferase [Serratia fonticola]CAI1909500.1 lipopolysaccharide core biosynthesis protein [Serratia fonticola]